VCDSAQMANFWRFLRPAKYRTQKLRQNRRLRSRCRHYIFVLWFLSSSFFLFSAPNLRGRRLNMYHTSTHDVSKSCILLYCVGSVTARSGAAAVRQTLWRGTRNGITKPSQRAPPIFGWAAITLVVGHRPTFPDSYLSLFGRPFVQELIGR